MSKLIFVGEGKTTSHYLKILEYQYLIKFLRYGPNLFTCDNNSLDFKIEIFANFGLKLTIFLEIPRSGI